MATRLGRWARRNRTLVTGAAVLGALAVGVPLAVGLFRADLPGRGPLRLAMALAVFVPMPLYAAGWLGGLRPACHALGVVPVQRLNAR